jgi:hypothetical protein
VNLDEFRKSYTWSEEYRHKCEVEYVCALPSHNARQDFLARVKKRRGEAGMQKLRGDAMKLWKETHNG